MKDCCPTRHINKYVYRYHTMTDVYTAALLQRKTSSDDDSGFRHGFVAVASLPLPQSATVVTHNTTRLCWIVVILWGYPGSFLFVSFCLMVKVQD